MFGNKSDKAYIAELRQELAGAKQTLEEVKAENERLSTELRKAYELIHEMEENAEHSIGAAIYEMMNGEHNEMEVTPWAVNAMNAKT